MALNDIPSLLTHFGENLTLLLALVLLYSLVGLPLLRRAGRFGALVASILFGGIAILGMQWPIEMVPGYGVDGRNLVVFAAAAFAGPWTAGITTAIVILYQIASDAPGLIAGIGGAVSAALLGVALYLRWWRRARIGGPGEFLGSGLVLAAISLPWNLIVGGLDQHAAFRLLAPLA